MRLRSFHCLPVLLEKCSEKLFSVPCTPLETRAAKILVQGHLMWPEELPNPFFLFGDSSSDPTDKANKKQNLPELILLWGKRFFFFPSLRQDDAMCQFLLDTEEVWMWEEGYILQGHRHTNMSWCLDGRPFASIRYHMALYKFTIILTYNAQLWKEQLPHLPRQEINRGRVKMLNRNQCHSYSLVHASCPSCKALQDGFSCFSYIMAVWV